MFLEVLKQGSAVAVHNALRYAGRARRVHDVKRVIEFDWSKRQLFAMAGKILPRCCISQARISRKIVGERKDHRATDAANRFDNTFYRRTYVAGLAVVVVAVNRE